MTDIKVEPVITDLPDASPSDPLEALSWLGDSVEAIADGLRARKVQGTPFLSDQCVLARYLQLWWPHACFAIGVAWDDDDLERDWKAPDVFEDFEYEFDFGHFPDLIEP